jgi:hypothetical protein
MAQSDALSQCFLGWTEEHHKKILSGYLVSGLRLECGTHKYEAGV